MSPTAIAAPPKKVAAYQRLLRAVPGIEEKSNFGSGSTALDGNMYSMISKHGVVRIRLSEADRAAFVAGYGAEPFRGDPAWPPSKELIAIPDDLLENTTTLAPWLERSIRHVQTLRPKPTKR